MDQRRKDMIEALRSLPAKIETQAEFAKMAACLLPHVPASDLPRLYRQLKDRKSSKLVALLPVFIKNEFLAAGFEGTSFTVFSDRASEGIEVLYFKEAEEYINETWDSELSDLEFGDFATIYLQDPATLAIESRVYIGLSRLWEGIASDQTKPMSEVVDDAIVLISDDELVYREIAGDGFITGRVFFHCVHCGCSINDDEACAGCGSKFTYNFRDIDWEREGMGCALPAQLERYFDSDSREPFFSIAPFVQRRREREAWMSNHQKNT